MFASLTKFLPNKKWVHNGIVAMGLFALGATSVQASQDIDNYPNRPVQMLLPFPAGGVTDATLRKIGERFSAITGQNMIIQNRPGRTNALSALANSAPDGYTLSLVGRNQMITSWLLGKSMPFDPINDFTWIDTLVSSWFGLFVRADSPYHSVDDLLAAARKKPDGVAYGTAFGVGGLTHAPMHKFAEMNNVQMLYVPYKGDAESLQSLLGGEIDAIVAAGSAMPYVDSGRLRLLAWVSGDPHPDYPEVKTLKELGHDVEAYSIVGLGGPKGMDPALVKKISGIFQQILAEPDTKEFLLGMFQRPSPSDPETFYNWAKNQLDKERQTLEEFNLLDAGANS